eukprot:762947-Hanusia_phi.AAC.12
MKWATPVELLEGRLGPDDEAAEMATRSELEEVQPVDASDLEAGNVPESLLDAVVVGVDKEGTLPLNVSPVPHLTLTTANLPGLLDVVDVIHSLDELEEVESVLGLGVRLDLVGDNKGHLRHIVHAVTTSHEESWHGGSSEGRANSNASLVGVGLGSPLAPGLGGVEHASSSAHVTEGSLTGAVGTSTTDTGDTGHSATSSPGDGGLLHTGLGVHSIGLALILGHVGVNPVNDVLADGGKEDVGEGEGPNALALLRRRQDGHNRTRCHCLSCFHELVRPQKKTTPPPLQASTLSQRYRRYGYNDDPPLNGPKRDHPYPT